MKNTIITGIIAVLVGIAIGWVIPHAGNEALVQGVSSAGAINNTAKITSASFVPSTASATSTSILNTDGTDREITSSFVVCSGVGTSLTYLTGAGLATWNVQMSTSSSATQTGNANYAANIVIGTSTTSYFAASTTETVPTYVGRIWPTNTYLQITFNATNTASCTAGVHYLSL